MTPNSHTSPHSITNHSHPPEHQPLLTPSPTTSNYHTIHTRTPPAHPSLRSPYLPFIVHIYFCIGMLLLLPITMLLVVLVINYFEPIPLLLPPQHSATVVPLWLCVISMFILTCRLVFFEIVSHSTHVLYLVVLGCTVADLVLVVGVSELRVMHSYLGLGCVGVCLVSTLWALFSSWHLHKHARVQVTCTTRFRSVVPRLGAFGVVVVSMLVMLGLVVDAVDLGLVPVGNRTMVRVGRVAFRVHVACDHVEGGGEGVTALVMTERGVSGVVGAQFLRDMVSRSHEEHAHLSPKTVCFWDRIGYAHSDFIYHALSIRLQTKALYQALEKHHQLDHHSASTHGGNHEKKVDETLGKFMLVSTGYGHLFAQDFAVQHPHLIHSFLHIDAETPASWYTPKVGLASGARAGYRTSGHGVWGSIVSDLFPALVEPIAIARIVGMVKGKTAMDRVLAPGRRVSSSDAMRMDLGGGGWRIDAAGGSNARLLMASWLERVDSNQGIQSANYVQLNDTLAEYHTLLAKRPVAVVSSFWRMHRDVAGWAEEQRGTLVAGAKNSTSLVGWWRVGDRDRRGGGGDEGGPGGICSTTMGRIFCEEAVRKLVVAGQMWNSTHGDAL